MAEIELVLRNPQDQNDTLSLWIEPYKSAISGKWISALKKTLALPHYLNKTFSFLGWTQNPRSLEVLLSEVNTTIEGLNRFNKKGVWNPPYHIEERCRTHDISNDELNRLHLHFEKLIGQTWQPSRYVQTADFETVLLIERLNFLIHEIEFLQLSKKMLARGFDQCPVIGAPFSKVDGHELMRAPLEDDDFNHFNLAEIFGEVRMRYCQTGKRHIDAWFDQDEHVTDANVNGLRYYSGAFTIRFGKTISATQTQESKTKFFAWLRAKGLNPKNDHYLVDKSGIKHGLGELKIGQLAPNQFGNRSLADIHALVSRYMDIFKIGLHENGNVTEAFYPFRNIEGPAFFR